MTEAAFYALLPRFRRENDGGPAHWAAVYSADGTPVAFTLSITDAKALAEQKCKEAA